MAVTFSSSSRLWETLWSTRGLFSKWYVPCRKKKLHRERQCSCEAWGTLSPISSFYISFAFIDPSPAAALISLRNADCQHKPLIIALETFNPLLSCVLHSLFLIISFCPPSPSTQLAQDISLSGCVVQREEGRITWRLITPPSSEGDWKQRGLKAKPTISPRKRPWLGVCGPLPSTRNFWKSGNNDRDWIPEGAKHQTVERTQESSETDARTHPASVWKWKNSSAARLLGFCHNYPQNNIIYLRLPCHCFTFIKKKHCCWSTTYKQSNWTEL